jgi:hypothetical protein
VVEEAVRGDLLDLGWLDRAQTLAPLRQHARWGALRAVVAERVGRIAAAMRG